MKTLQIYPKYGCLKEEIISNPMSSIPVEQFITEYKKSEIHFNSNYCGQDCARNLFPRSVITRTSPILSVTFSLSNKAKRRRQILREKQTGLACSEVVLSSARGMPGLVWWKNMERKLDVLLYMYLGARPSTPGQGRPERSGGRGGRS